MGTSGHQWARVGTSGHECALLGIHRRDERAAGDARVLFYPLARLRWSRPHSTRSQRRYSHSYRRRAEDSSVARSLPAMRPPPYSSGVPLRPTARRSRRAGCARAVRSSRRRGPPSSPAKTKIAVEGSFLGSPPGSDAVRPSCTDRAMSCGRTIAAARSTRASTAAHRAPRRSRRRAGRPARRSAEDSEDPGSQQRSSSRGDDGRNDLPRSREFAERELPSPPSREPEDSPRASPTPTRASLARAGGIELGGASPSSTGRGPPCARRRARARGGRRSRGGRWGSPDGALWVAVGVPVAVVRRRGSSSRRSRRRRAPTLERAREAR